ncbi:MAG: DUF4394 domain-containing protein [Phycisphaerales bacterium]
MTRTNRARAVSLSSFTVALAIGAAGSAAGAELIYGVTDTQDLITFNSNAPETILSGRAISGLQQNEIIRGIDFRPADGMLYALGSTSRLYSIDTGTGVATAIGGPFGNALNGSRFGFDFNPTIDRIRVVSDADQNLVLNPDTGSSTMVTPLFYGPGDANEGANPNVVGSAYTNSFAGSTMTQLYGIDTNLDILVTQANSAGTLGTVGPLGVDLNDNVGFDISGSSGVAYAAVMDAALSKSTFWTIDLSTGQAFAIGEIGGGAFVSSIAVVPGPGAAGAMAIVALGAARRRRR